MALFEGRGDEVSCELLRPGQGPQAWLFLFLVTKALGMRLGRGPDHVCIFLQWAVWIVWD